MSSGAPPPDYDEEFNRRLEQIEEAVAATLQRAQPIPGVEENNRSEPSEYFEATRVRRFAGYLLQAAGLGIVLKVVGKTGHTLAEMTQLLPDGEIELHYKFAILGTQALVSVASIGIAVGLLRVGERMSLPHWWDNKKTRIMLGLDRAKSAPREIKVTIPESLERRIWGTSSSSRSDDA